MQAAVLNRLQKKYREEVVPAFLKEKERSSFLAVPRVAKVTVNMGIGRVKDEANFRESAMADLTVITGQRPSFRRARKAISGFKLRAGEIVGLTVTLRGARMWAFLDKLFSTALPRVRDFRGLPRRSFDGRGNYTIGISEHTIFPEVDPNKVDRTKSMEVTITCTADNDEDASFVLEKLGLPLEKK